MLMFAIVFRHPNTCSNYQHLSLLLERTLRSACNQTVKDFVVVVVCNQLPEITFTDDRIIFKTVDFPIPETRHQVLLDKGVKRLVSLQFALKNPAITHFMTLDGDDLVSCHLLEKAQHYLQKNPSGLTLNRGYLLDFHNQRLQEKFGFNHYCGSSLIMNLNLVMSYLNCNLDLFKQCVSYEQFLDCCDQYVVKELLGDHRQPKHYFKENGKALTLIEEPLSVWVVNNGENVSRTTIGKGNRGISEDFIDEYGLTGSISNAESSILDRIYERIRFYKSWLGYTSRNLKQP